MKQGWEEKKLGQVCELLNRGISPKYLEKNGLCVLNQKCIRNHQVSFEDSRRHDSAVKSVNSERYIQLGDVLVNSTGTGTLGRVAQVREKPNEDTTVDSHVTIVRPQKGLFFNDFFGYMLIHIEEEIKLSGEGCGGQTELARSVLAEKFNVKYPKSIQDQKRIVAILDEVFSAIATAKANAEKNLKNAQELFESYLQSVFENKGEEWEEKELRELTTILGDGLHGTPKYTTDGEYYFINGNNLSDGVIEFKDSTKRVSVEEYNKHKKNLTNRTVLVSINGTLGNVAFYNNEKVILGKSACYFNLKESVNKHYIRYILSSPFFIKYAHKEATGATIKNVSLKTMREFCIPLPTIHEQVKIVQKLDSLSIETKRLESIYQQKISDLDELKKTILQKAFNGELNLDKVAV